jgi:hypothetical protein
MLYRDAVEAPYQAALEKRKAGLHSVRVDARSRHNPLLRVVHGAMFVLVRDVYREVINDAGIGVNSLGIVGDIRFDDWLDSYALGIGNMK